jgi:hypothetical protein
LDGKNSSIRPVLDLMRRLNGRFVKNGERIMDFMGSWEPIEEVLGSRLGSMGKKATNLFLRWLVMRPHHADAASL